MTHLKLAVTPNKPFPQVYLVYRPMGAASRMPGKWVDRLQPLEGILEEAQQLSTQHSDDKVEIYDKDFYSLSIDWNEDLGWVHEKALFITSYGELGAKLLVHYGGILAWAQAALERNYQAAYQDELNYATLHFKKFYWDHIPELTPDFVNYEKFSNALFEKGYFSINAQGCCQVLKKN